MKLLMFKILGIV